MSDHRETLSPPTAAPLSLSDRVQSLRLPSGPPPDRRSPLAWVPWLLCLVLAGSTGVFAYRAFTAPPPEQGKEPANQPAGQAGAAAGGNNVAPAGEVVLESKGYIMPAHKIQVSPRVGGMVEKLLIEEGMRVKKGDVLAQLETIDYQADADRAQGVLDEAKRRLDELTRNHPEEIKQAKAELEEAEAQKQQLLLEYKRNHRLRSGQAVAERDYEQAESAYKAMERKVERLRVAFKLMSEGPRLDRIKGAEASVRQAEADLVKARWRLDNCTVRAPVSGTILTKKAEEGNMVNPVAFNISATLCDMADLSDLEVDMYIQERDVAKVFKDQRCRVRPDAFADRIYSGVVSRLMPIADRARGAIPVRVKLTVPKEEEGVYLKPDMGVIVSFLKDKEVQAKK